MNGHASVLRGRTGVLVAVEHVLLRQGLVRMLADDGTFAVVAEATNDEQALAAVARHRPDVLLVEASLPRHDASGLIATMRPIEPECRAVVLAMADDDEPLFEAVRAGATALLDTEAGANELMQCLREVVAGEMSVSHRLAGRLLQKYAWLASNAGNGGRRSRQALTDREREVLQMLVDGLTNGQIAGRLVITENTVRSHLRSILHKLHAQNRVQAAAYAMANGLAAVTDRQPTG